MVFINLGEREEGEWSAYRLGRRFGENETA